MSLPFSPQNPVRRVIAYILLALVLIAGSFVLRQGRDAQAAGLRERDAEALRTELSAELKMTDADSAELVKLGEDRLRDLASLVPMSPRERLHRIFHAAKPMPYDFLTHRFTAISLQDTTSLPADEAFEIIAPQMIRLTENTRAEIHDTLAANALSSGDADLAAIIIQHGTDMDRADLATLQRLVATFRQAGRPVSAYRSVQNWLGCHRNSALPAERETAEQLEFDLAMESGHPDEALSICLKSLNGYREDEPLNERLLDRACQAALITSRSKEVLPFMKRFVASFPEAKVQWWELAKTACHNPQRSARYREWVRRAADVADQNVLADDAYFYHLRLAATGDISYLDRFYPLANYLNRVEECMQVLQSLPAQPDGVSIHVRLARLIAANGKPDHAMRLFNEWLRLHPTDQAVRLDLVSLMEETGDRTGAILQLEKWQAGEPDNLVVTRKLAECHLRAGHVEKALSNLDLLPDDDFDAALVSGYQLAAESLGSTTSLLRALRLGLDHDGRSAEIVYLRMAAVADQTGASAAALDVLREAVGRLPTKTALRLELASRLIATGKHDEALRELSHPSLTQSPAKESLVGLARKQQRNTIAQTEIRKALPVGSAAGVENMP